MSRTLLFTITAVLFTGCVEYDLSQELPQWPDSIAPPIEDPVQEDVIVQVTTPMVDILWTIDNSCSMADEQDALSTNFPVFMDYFLGSGLDYHVGVVSTDLDNPSHQGKLRTAAGIKYLDPETPNPVQVFGTMASMGVSGSGTERGLGATYLGIEVHKDTYNAGFYRDEASIHTVLISDERDQTQASMITQPEFVDWYDGLKVQSDERTFSSVITMTGPDAGTAYKNTSLAIGGIVWDITNEDWGEVLDRLGVQASGLKREYFLSQRPVAATIEVEVLDVNGATFRFEEAVGDPPVGDWVYDESRNSVSFLEYIPNALAKVVLRYKVLAAVQDSVEEEL